MINVYEWLESSACNQHGITGISYVHLNQTENGQNMWSNDSKTQSTRQQKVVTREMNHKRRIAPACCLDSFWGRAGQTPGVKGMGLRVWGGWDTGCRQYRGPDRRELHRDRTSEICLDTPFPPFSHRIQPSRDPCKPGKQWSDLGKGTPKG